MSESSKDYISRVDEMGNLHISEAVLAGIAAAAARETEGVSALAGGRAENTSGLVIGKKVARSVEIRVSEDKVSIAVAILVKYGYVIPDVGRAVQEAVANAVENTTGLKVDCVNVHVVGVAFQ
ncbi:MAG: Asp23/Gls24 family envelope stress response protein [Oscillospiraceae bacterium]|nr:Asp23/Gls24 family envelope stress response protein [Oscillospiraceae bacterium]